MISCCGKAATGFGKENITVGFFKEGSIARICH